MHGLRRELGAGAYGLEAELEEAGAEGEEAILHLAVRKPLVGSVALAPAQAVTLGVQREAAPNDKPTLCQSTTRPPTILKLRSVGVAGVVLLEVLVERGRLGHERLHQGVRRMDRSALR
jgi:hypothetical protein